MAEKLDDVPKLVLMPNGRYSVKWRVKPDTGKPGTTSLRTSNLAEAKTRYASILIGNDETYLDAAPGRLTDTATVLDLYMSEHVEPRCLSPFRIRSAVKPLKEFFGDLPMADIDIPMCRAYTEWRKRAPGTVKQELRILMAAYNHARRWGRMNDDARPKMEYPRVPPKETEVYSYDEIQTLLSSAKGPLRTFVTLAYFTASRRNAIERLEWCQVDFERRVINLHKRGAVVTNKRRAIVPINDACIKELQAQKKRSRGAFVFDKPLAFYMPFKTLCTKVGMPDRSNPHLLRHSRATHLLQEGVSIFKVAVLLGDSPMMVESRYGHHYPEHAASAVTSHDSWMAAG